MSLKGSIFLSYTQEDEQLADLLRVHIESELGVEGLVFFSSATIIPADEWWKKLQDSITNCKLVLVLATPISVTKRWVNIESGMALGHNIPIVPMCAYGLKIEDLQPPLSHKQAVDLAHDSGVRRLLQRLAQEVDRPLSGEPDVSHIVAEASRVQKRSPDILLSQAQQYGIGAVLSRKELPREDHGLQWHQLLTRCTQSIRVIGWSCMNVFSGVTRNEFKKFMANDNRLLEVLVLDPDAAGSASRLNFGPVCEWPHSAVMKDLEDGIRAVKEFASALSSSERERLIIKKTRWLMAWSAVALDLGRNTGLIQVELYLYNQPINHRPELILEPGGQFYQDFARSISEIWKDAVQIE